MIIINKCGRTHSGDSIRYDHKWSQHLWQTEFFSFLFWERRGEAFIMQPENNILSITDWCALFSERQILSLDSDGVIFPFSDIYSWMHALYDYDASYGNKRRWIYGRLLLRDDSFFGSQSGIRMLSSSGKMRAFTILFMVSGTIASTVVNDGGRGREKWLSDSVIFPFFSHPQPAACWASGASGWTITRGQEQSPKLTTHWILVPGLIPRGEMEQVGKEARFV